MTAANYRPTKIISGGQTGADQAALFTARLLGIPTGGTAPKGWRTQTGPAPWLAEFGLVESDSADYPPRTQSNVCAADATVVFGHPRRGGSRLTREMCVRWGKPYIVNPSGAALADWAERLGVRTLNVAGSRASKVSGIFDHVEWTLLGAFGPAERPDAWRCGPCATKVRGEHNDCHRIEGGRCECPDRPTCGVHLRVFTAGDDR